MSFNRILSAVIAFILVLPHVSVALGDTVRWDDHPDGLVHWYEVVPTQLSWTDAKSDAEARGGYLVTVTSQAETDFIVDNLGSAILMCWLGALQDPAAPGWHEPDGGWTWITGETWDYTNWEPRSGEPNNVNGNESNINFHGDPWELGSWCDVFGDAAHGPGGYVLEKSGQVPTPSAFIALIGMGAMGLVAAARRRRREA